MPKTRSPACTSCVPAGTRSTTPAKSMPTTNGYDESAVSRPRRLLSSGFTPANRTRMRTSASAVGAGRSCTAAGSPKRRTANARIQTSIQRCAANIFVAALWSTPDRRNKVSLEHAIAQAAFQTSNLCRRAPCWARTDQWLEVPARRDPRDRDGHAVNEQGPAYLRRETRLMEYVERPLLGSGEPVDQDLSLGASEEPPQQDGGCLLVSSPQHDQAVRVPQHPPSPGVAVHHVHAGMPATQPEGHILGTRTPEPTLHFSH